MLICLNTVAPQSADERETMERCIARLANGNAAAMEPLYNIANAAVYAFALSMLKNRHDAEEAAQDCFVKAYAGAGTYRPQGKPMAWLIAITRNICLDRLRERAKHAHAPMEDWESYVEQAAVSSEDRLVLEQCMNALDDAERHSRSARGRRHEAPRNRASDGHDPYGGTFKIQQGHKKAEGKYYADGGHLA